MYTVYLSHHVDIIIVQKYFILKSFLKILFYFVFSKYFVGVFYFCNFKILFKVFCTSLLEGWGQGQGQGRWIESYPATLGVLPGVCLTVTASREQRPWPRHALRYKCQSSQDCSHAKRATRSCITLHFTTNFFLFHTNDPEQQC